MDLFNTSANLSLVDQPSHLRLVGMAIWLLKLRFEIQLAVIMACNHNAEPTQGDLIKAIRLLTYLAYERRTSPRRLLRRSLRMSWIEGNLHGLDLQNDVEWSIVGADAEGD